ncbi:MAG: hypothetical protein QG650_879 [Patescibacteria group bacterium]|nr:hypothetical protein [Patescibacteria group bacterium]
MVDFDPLRDLLENGGIISENCRIQVWRKSADTLLCPFRFFAYDVRRWPFVAPSEFPPNAPWIPDTPSRPIRSTCPTTASPNRRPIRPKARRCFRFPGSRTIFPIPGILRTVRSANCPDSLEMVGYSFSTIPGSFLRAWRSGARHLRTATGSAAKKPGKYFFSGNSRGTIRKRSQRQQTIRRLGNRIPVLRLFMGNAVVPEIRFPNEDVCQRLLFRMVPGSRLWYFPAPRFP